MAEHYFPEGKFKEAAPPSTDDLEPRKLLPKDLMGKVYIKYTCHFQIRKVNFFEIYYLKIRHDICQNFYTSRFYTSDASYKYQPRR